MGVEPCDVLDYCFSFTFDESFAMLALSTLRGKTDMATHTRPGLVRERFVATSLGQLYVVEQGQGPETLILWPSIFTDRHIYDELVKVLGRTYRCLLIDGPGHGRSIGIETVFSMSTCAEAIVQVMDAFELRQAIVGGTSWGGLASAELALRAPERLRALILMNTPMEIDGTKLNMKSRMIAFGARWMLHFKAFREGVAKSFFDVDTLPKNRSYARAFHAMLREADPKTLSTAVSSVILHGRPLKARLHKIQVPTLVIAGIEDKMYPLATQAAAALHLSNARFEPVPGHHISVVDAPEPVAVAIQNFVLSTLCA